jgi:hypothetical protein
MYTASVVCFTLVLFFLLSAAIAHDDQRECLVDDSATSELHARLSRLERVVEGLEARVAEAETAFEAKIKKLLL